MNNQSIGLSFLIFAVVGIPVSIFSWNRRKNDSFQQWFSLLSLGNLSWVVCSALFFLVPDMRLAGLFFRLRFMCVGVLCIGLMVVVLKNNKIIKISFEPLFCLFSVPAISGLLALSDTYLGTGLLYSSLSIVEQQNVRVPQVGYAYWFWVHLAVCASLILFSLRIMLQHSRVTQTGYRAADIILLFSVTVSPVLAIMAAFGWTPLQIDLVPSVNVIAISLCYFAVTDSHAMDILISSRESVFERTAHAIFVLSTDGHIMDYNQTALSMGKSIGLEQLKDVSLEEMLEDWLSKNNGSVTDREQLIYTVHRATEDEHYQVGVQKLLDRKQQLAGYYVELKNITPMMSLIHQLQESAYFDNLTGLHNRNYLINFTLLWESEELLPLGVTVGDLNNLKHVNDSRGHLYGDRVLQTAARVLEDNKPQGAVVIRTGGDEFIVLTPNATKERLDEYEKRVEQECDQLAEEENVVGIALASKLRVRSEEPLWQVIDQADKAMYSTKRSRRSQERGQVAPVTSESR